MGFGEKMGKKRTLRTPRGKAVKEVGNVSSKDGGREHAWCSRLVAGAMEEEMDEEGWRGWMESRTYMSSWAKLRTLDFILRWGNIGEF